MSINLVLKVEEQLFLKIKIFNFREKAFSRLFQRRKFKIIPNPDVSRRFQTFPKKWKNMEFSRLFQSVSNPALLFFPAHAANNLFLNDLLKIQNLWITSFKI